MAQGYPRGRAMTRRWMRGSISAIRCWCGATLTKLGWISSTGWREAKARGSWKGAGVDGYRLPLVAARIGRGGLVAGRIGGFALMAFFPALVAAAFTSRWPHYL